jgi:hypothetical protein
MHESARSLCSALLASSTNKCHQPNTTNLTETYFFFTLPGQYSFQMTESSVTHVCTDCQNIGSGRFGGNLRTTVFRRSVPLAFDCPWRFSFSLALDRDLFFAGSIVTLDIGGKCGRAVAVYVLYHVAITRLIGLIWKYKGRRRYN